MATSYFACIIFAFLQMIVAASSLKVVPFTYCDNEKSLLTLVIDPCLNPTNKAVCTFKHGSKVKVDAAFIAPFSSGNLETDSTATFKGRSIPFPDTGSNPCQGKIVPRCPVQKGNVYLLNYRMDIMKYYPTGPMEIKFSIRDKKTKQVLSCAKIPIVVTRNSELTYVS